MEQNTQSRHSTLFRRDIWVPFGNFRLTPLNSSAATLATCGFRSNDSARDVNGNDATFVMARVEGEIPRVTEILSSTAIAASGRLHLGLGCVHSGFRLRESRNIVVGCDQMFHRTELRRSGRKRLGKAIDSFLDLREGDLIVHLSHGIGRFRGTGNARQRWSADRTS